MPDELNLSPEAYAPASPHEVRVGDVCQAVGLPDPADAQLYESKDLPGRFALAARVVYALVVSVYEGYVIVVPITTADVAADHEQFEALVASGHSARWWMRLPPLEGAWTEDAIALLFMPQTLPEEALADRRLAAMHSSAREIVSRRLLRALTRRHPSRLGSRRPESATAGADDDHANDHASGHAHPRVRAEGAIRARVRR